MKTTDDMSTEKVIEQYMGNKWFSTNGTKTGG